MELLTAWAPLGAAVAGGYALRQVRLCQEVDAQAVARFVNWCTLPSLILQTISRVPPEPLELAAALGCAAFVGAAAAGASWLLAGRQHPKERGLLAGCAVGSGLALGAYPLAQAAFGTAGLRLALLWGLANSVAVWAGSFLLFGSAGAAFPEKYEHTDGGRYAGEWRGMVKEGFGVYAYPSGARYEGEWVDNLKSGRGVYHFPSGGVYEGEWRGGRQEGLGVRTFASGKVQAGLWREGRLEAALDERQCALAVEGANEAAAAARRVPVGGSSLQGAFAQLVADSPTWAYAAAAALALLGRPLTPTLDAITRQLAAVHAPLALLALGLSLDLQPPQARQMREVTAVLAIRLLPGLLAAATASAVLAGPLGWPAAHVVAVVGPLLLCAVAPVAPQAQAYAHRFRLNENLAAAIGRASHLAALLLMPLLAGAAALAGWAGTLRPLQLALMAAGGSVALAAAAGLQQRPSAPGAGQAGQRRGKVRMVYAGPSGEEAPAAAQEAAGTAPAAPAAAADTAPGEGASAGAAVEAEAEPTQALQQNQTEAGASTLKQQQQQQRRSTFQDVEGGPEAGGSGGQAGGPAPAPQALPGGRQRLRPRQPLLVLPCRRRQPLRGQRAAGRVVQGRDPAAVGALARAAL